MNNYSDVIRRASIEEPRLRWKTVMKRAGKVAKYLRVLHPDLFQIIKSRHNAQRNSDAASRRSAYRAEIARAVVELLHRGLTPSRRKVLASIPHLSVRETVTSSISKSSQLCGNGRRRRATSLPVAGNNSSRRPGTIRWPHRFGRITWPKRPSDGWSDSSARIASHSSVSLGKDAETRFTPSGRAHTRFSLATNVSRKDKDSVEYKTRTEWHRIVVWGKFGEWAGSLKKGAFIEAEGELRYREFQPNGSDAKIRTAEIHAISILTLDRAEKTEQEDETAVAELSGNDDTF